MAGDLNWHQILQFLPHSKHITVWNAESPQLEWIQQERLAFREVRMHRKYMGQLLGRGTGIFNRRYEDRVVQICNLKHTKGNLASILAKVNAIITGEARLPTWHRCSGRHFLSYRRWVQKHRRKLNYWSVITLSSVSVRDHLHSHR